MSGWTSTMFSPSRVTTRRSTPCVLGCCGPMLSMSSSVRTVMPLAPGLGRRRDAPAQEWFPADLLLEFQESLIQRFRPWRAAWDVDVHRDDLVDAFEDGVVVVVEWPAAGGAAAHADHILRLGHLLPQPADDRRDLDRRAPGHDDAVGLPRGPARDDADAVGVEARRHELHHLDGAAGQAEREGPHRRGPAPVQHVLHLREDDPPAGQGIDDFKDSIQRKHLAAAQLLWVGGHALPPWRITHPLLRRDGDDVLPSFHLTCCWKAASNARRVISGHDRRSAGR